MKIVVVISLLCLVGIIAGYRYGYHFEKESIFSEERSQKKVSHVNPTANGLRKRERPVRLQPAELVSLINTAGRGKELRAATYTAQLFIQDGTLQEVRAMLEILYELTVSETRSYLLGKLFKRLAEFDPEEALTIALSDQIQNKRDLLIALGTIMRTFAKQSPMEAFEFLKSASSRVAHYKIRGSLVPIFREWSKVDFNEAFHTLQKLPDDFDRSTALTGLLLFQPENQARRAELLSFAENLPDPQMRQEALLKLVSKWSKSEPSLEKIEEWLSSRQSINLEERARLERAVVDPHLHQDPLGMADWLLRRATPDSFSSHLEAVVRGWPDLQPNACAKWLSGFELNEHTDLAVSSFSKKISQDDPASAFHWAQAITEQMLRLNTMKRVVGDWKQFEPEAARRFVTEANLSEKERTLLLSEGTRW